jgi:hypothetical protein
MSADPTYHLIGTLGDDMSLRFQYAEALRGVFGHMFGKDLDIQVTILRKNRSNRQNRYLHGVVVPTVQAWLKETEGESFDHDKVYTMLRMDLGDTLEITQIQGKDVITMTGKRFSKMDTKEFAEAIDKLVAIYAEKECYIQLPNEECFLTDFINAEDK